MTYKPKPPRRVILAAKVEPHIKEWLQKQFPESVSHGVNYILAEYMSKHTKSGIAPEQRTGWSHFDGRDECNKEH